MRPIEHYCSSRLIRVGERNAEGTSDSNAATACRTSYPCGHVDSVRTRRPTPGHWPATGIQPTGADA